MYLEYFSFPDIDEENELLMYIKETCYNSKYPFQVIAREDRVELEFEPITILYGSNGSGKTTMLNVIAEKLGLDRFSTFNYSSFYEDYISLCDYEYGRIRPRERRMITSDDIFDYMFRQREHNNEIDYNREKLYDEYKKLKAESHGFRMRSLAEGDKIEKMAFINSRSHSKSDFVRKHLQKNKRTHSNGESSILFFSENMSENGLYLLDEPENSLSPDTQLQLVKFLEEQVRFFKCQLIIATHSPFILSMKCAKIYNVDSDEVEVSRWTELPNVRAYYDFFMEKKSEFEKNTAHNGEIK